MRWRFRHVLRRRGAGPQPGAVPAARARRRRAGRPLPGRRPGAGDLRLQRRRTRRCSPTSPNGSPVSRSSGCRRTTAAPRRSSPPAATCCAAPVRTSRRSRPVPTATRCGIVADRRRGRRGRRRSPASSASLDPDLVRRGQVAVLARTNAQLIRLGRACADAGVAAAPGRRSSPAARSPTPSVPSPPCRRRRGCAAGRTTCSTHAPGDPADPIETAERRLAGAVLEFLRDQPLGDGAALRAWIAGDRTVLHARRHRRRRAVDVPRGQGTRVAHRRRHGRRDRARPPPVGQHRRRPGGGGAAAARRPDAGDRPAHRHLGGPAGRLRPQAEPVARRARRRGRGRRRRAWRPPAERRGRDRRGRRPVEPAHRLAPRGRRGPPRCCPTSCARTATSPRSSAPRRDRPRSSPRSPASGPSPPPGCSPRSARRSTGPTSSVREVDDDRCVVAR